MGGSDVNGVFNPAEFKTKIIKRYQKGESIQSLSQELRIAQSAIYHWRKEYCSIKTANRTYTPKEFDALSRRLEKLEHEMEIIKQSGYIADGPLQKKLSVLESIYRQADSTYSVHELCEALDVARGTFYNYIFRRADHSKREEAQIELMRLVQQAFDDSSQRFGAEKIRVTLAAMCSGRNQTHCGDHAGARAAKHPLRREKAIIRNSSSIKNKTCWNANSLPTIQTRFGSAILHPSKSMTTGCISASFSTCSPAKSSVIEYPAMPVQIWSPAHSEPLSVNAAILGKL